LFLPLALPSVLWLIAFGIGFGTFKISEFGIGKLGILFAIYIQIPLALYAGNASCSSIP
jgi:hypothetical protein